MQLEQKQWQEQPDALGRRALGLAATMDPPSYTEAEKGRYAVRPRGVAQHLKILPLEPGAAHR